MPVEGPEQPRRTEKEAVPGAKQKGRQMRKTNEKVGRANLRLLLEGQKGAAHGRVLALGLLAAPTSGLAASKGTSRPSLEVTRLPIKMRQGI